MRDSTHIFRIFVGISTGSDADFVPCQIAMLKAIQVTVLSQCSFTARFDLCSRV